MDIVYVICALIVFGLFFTLFTFYMQRRWEKRFSKFVSRTEDQKNATMAGVPMDSGMNDNYMINYNEEQFGGNFLGAVRSDPIALRGSGINEKAPEDVARQMVTVKPIDVIKELQRSPTNWSLNGLDDKISIVKSKKDLIGNSRSGRDLDALLLCLENRKKSYDEYEYEPDKTMTFKAFFEQWDTTTEAHIHTLTEKYNHLEFHSADVFVPEFPDDATRIMTSYNDAVVSLCGKKPRFYVIAKAEDFKKKYESRDPILLVQSPFGIYYHILGAWDSEMIYLPEL